MIKAMIKRFGSMSKIVINNEKIKQVNDKKSWVKEFQKHFITNKSNMLIIRHANGNV